MSNVAWANPNVNLVCLGPSTSLLRTALTNATMLYITGQNATISGCSLDANSLASGNYTLNGAGLNYGGGVTYAINQYVLASGLYYISLQNSNTGHTPASSPTFWQPTRGAVIIVDGSSTPISGFQLLNCTITGPDGDVAIYMPGVSNFLISGNVIKNGSIFGEKNAKNGQLIGNNVSNAPFSVSGSAEAFHSTSSGQIVSDISIVGDKIHGQAGFGIEIGAFGGLSPTGIVISGVSTDMPGPGSGGISLDNVTSPLVDASFKSLGQSPFIAGVEIVDGSNGGIFNVTLVDGPVVINQSSNNKVTMHATITSLSGPCLFIITSVASTHTDNNDVTGGCDATGGQGHIVSIQVNATGATVNDNILRNFVINGDGSQYAGVYLQYNSGTMSGTRFEGISSSGISAMILADGASINNRIGCNYPHGSYAYQSTSGAPFTITCYNQFDSPGNLVINGTNPGLSSSSGTFSSTSIDTSWDLTSATTGTFAPTITFASTSSGIWKCGVYNLTNPTAAVVPTGSPSSTQAAFSGTTTSGDHWFGTCQAPPQ